MVERNQRVFGASLRALPIVEKLLVSSGKCSEDCSVISTKQNARRRKSVIETVFQFALAFEHAAMYGRPRQNAIMTMV